MPSPKAAKSQQGRVLSSPLKVVRGLDPAGRADGSSLLQHASTAPTFGRGWLVLGRESGPAGVAFRRAQWPNRDGREGRPTPSRAARDDPALRPPRDLPVAGKPLVLKHFPSCGPLKAARPSTFGSDLVGGRKARKGKKMLLGADIP